MSQISVDKLNKIIIISFVLFLSVVLISPSNPFENLPGQDNGVFLYAGQQILQGDIPYRDFWDHKGPLVFYLNALGLALASGSRWGVWILELTFLFLTAVGIYQIAEKKWSRLIAVLSLVIWFIFLTRVSSYLRFGDSNYTETYSLLFSVWTIFFYLWSQENKKTFSPYFLIGIFASLSFALRPNNISIYLSIIIIELFGYIFWDNQLGLRRIIYIAIGGATGLALIYLFFWINNAETELLDAIFTYNFEYSQKNGNPKNRFSVFMQGVRNFYWLPVIIIIGSTVQLIYLYIKKKLLQNQFTLLLLIGFLIEVVLSSLSGRALLHYYISWVPMIVLLLINFLYSLVPIKLKDIFAKQNIAQFGILIIIVLFCIFNISSVLTYIRIFNEIRNTHQLERESAMIEFIKNTTEPENKILVWGNDVWINFLANRESPTKYAYQYSLFLPNYTNHQKVESFLEDLKTCPPIYILEPIVNTDEIIPLSPERLTNLPAAYHLPDGMQEVFNFFREHYSFLREFNEVIIYQWNGQVDVICKN